MKVGAKLTSLSLTMTSLKKLSLWYQGGPFADEKIPYEALSLQCMCEAHSYKQATIVLAGPGWHPVKYYYYLHEYECPTKVRIISYDEFVHQYL